MPESQEIRIQKYDPDTLKVSPLPVDCLDAQNLALSVAGNPQGSAEILRSFHTNICVRCRRTHLQLDPSYLQTVSQIDGKYTLLCQQTEPTASDDSTCLMFAHLAVHVTTRSSE